MADNETDCAESDGCREDDYCHYNAVTRKCDEGTRRVNETMFWNGVAIVIAGGTSTVVGGVLLLSLLFEDLSCGWGHGSCSKGFEQQAQLYAGEALLIGGPVIMLGIGVPLAVFGGQHVPREPHPPRVRLEIGPTGASLATSF